MKNSQHLLLAGREIFQTLVGILVVRVDLLLVELGLLIEALLDGPQHLHLLVSAVTVSASLADVFGDSGNHSLVAVRRANAAVQLQTAQQLKKLRLARGHTEANNVENLTSTLKSNN